MNIESPLDVVKKLDAAFNRKDIEAVLECYEDHATMVVEPGKWVCGKEALKKVFETIFEFDGVATQEKMKVLESGDLALFISKWSLANKTADGLLETKEFHATCVFRRNSEGRWKLVIDNSFGTAILDA